jgi:tRNA pseudouridine38-40 synthase
VDLTQAAWDIRVGSASFYITGNRFLRGMVRLVVGACLNAGLGKLSLDTLRDALDRQVLIPKSWSAPAEGLFLVKVNYPDF